MSDRWQKAVVRRRASDTVGGAGPALRRRRMSAKRKQSPILRLRARRGSGGQKDRLATARI